jgi:endonuclease/exonuclease/phosphatase family metal-dependent hydrolase
MFYNVENLFDPFKDSLTNDGEFTSQGTRYWTWNRMTQKLNNIYRVVTAVGEWDLPAIVGFCEVENSFVMYQLINKTPLSKFDYKLVHKESPDSRGIDVALIYRPDRFMLEEKRFFRVVNPDDPDRKTRDVLYARGILGKLDTLHVFVNHWPSKFGGELASEPGRIAAGRLVREKVDSIRIFSPDARIIIMGDFNDGPNSAPITEALKAVPPTPPYSPKGLYNLHHKFEGQGIGTIKFQGAWEVIDMMIVSKSLLDKSHPIYLNPDGGMIFQADFLIEPDVNFFGIKPFRTYIGFKYHGGFSDHFPIFVDIYPNR